MSQFDKNAIVMVSYCNPEPERWLTYAWDDDEVVTYDEGTEDEYTYDPAEARFDFLRWEADRHNHPHVAAERVTWIDYGFGEQLNGEANGPS